MDTFLTDAVDIQREIDGGNWVSDCIFSHPTSCYYVWCSPAARLGCDCRSTERAGQSISTPGLWFCIESHQETDCRIHFGKFGKLTLRKVIKIVATSWRIFRLKYTKFDFGWGSATDSSGGAYSVLPVLTCLLCLVYIGLFGLFVISCYQCCPAWQLFTCHCLV